MGWEVFCMAQLAIRARLLARRLGLRPSGAVLAALVVTTLGVTGVGVGTRMASQRGFEVIAQEESGEAASGGDEELTLSQEAPEPEANPEVEVCVHVDGAVEQPGVYVLRGVSPRVGEAVDLAGGLTEDADTTTVNLAAPLTDGQKVYVPAEGEQAPAAGVGVSEAADGSVININTATAEELQGLPGVGQATAAAIVEERESGGPFTSPEDIMRVSGIGEKKYERMKDHIGV